MAFECMEDCIHLKACRRVQRIGKNLRLQVPRYCDEECSAYERIEKLPPMVTTENAVDYALFGAPEIESGFLPGNVYAECDLDGIAITDAVRIVPGDYNYTDRNLDGIPLWNLHLNSRCIHALEKNNVHTIEDLELVPHDKLVMFRGLGETSIRQIENALKNYHDRFREKTDEEIVDEYE